MVAEDFLQDQQVRQWLNGVEPAWTLLTFDSLRALRREPSARQNAIRIANDLSADEIAGSAVTRNTFILLRQVIERGGLPLTATGSLSRAAVAEMGGLIEWPHYHQVDAFRLNKVINEPDFLPLHIVRILAQAATLVRAQRGKLVTTPLGKSMLSDERQGSLLANSFGSGGTSACFILRPGAWTSGILAAVRSAHGRRLTSALCCGRYLFQQATGKPARS